MDFSYPRKATLNNYQFKTVFVYMPSTVISGFDYDETTETLTVRYVSGKTYAYQQVPLKVYRDMRSSFAKGVFLNRNIKGKYSFIEIQTA